jgi:hypothetical protein
VYLYICLSVYLCVCPSYVLSTHYQLCVNGWSMGDHEAAPLSKHTSLLWTFLSGVGSKDAAAGGRLRATGTKRKYVRKEKKVKEEEKPPPAVGELSALHPPLLPSCLLVI